MTINEKNNKMAKTENISYSLAEMKDKYIGTVGTVDRDEYEYELRMDVLGKMIKTARQERHLTQEELGKLIGVQKAQISRLENNASNVTMDTLMRVFTALNAKVKLQIERYSSFIKHFGTPRKGLDSFTRYRRS